MIIEVMKPEQQHSNGKANHGLGTRFSYSNNTAPESGTKFRIPSTFDARVFATDTTKTGISQPNGDLQKVRAQDVRATRCAPEATDRMMITMVNQSCYSRP